MASKGSWTVVFEDKLIIKQSGDGAGAYEIDNDSFWSESKWSNIWAVQYGTTTSSDEVEYRDSTAHTSWTDANLGSFQTQFIDKWDAAHLAKLQADWDADNVDDETSEQKIARLGARPTSYSSN